ISSPRQGVWSNLMTGAFSRGTRRLSGKLRPLTLGSGNEASPSVSATGKLVFTSQNYSASLWEAVPGKNASAVEMRPLTQNGAKNYRPSVSDDGGKLAYLSDRTGSFHVWVRDLKTGAESALTSSAKQDVCPAISRDGQRVASWDGTAVFLLAANGGAPQLLCRQCGRPDDWSLNGKLILGPGLVGEGISVRDPGASSSIKIIA